MNNISTYRKEAGLSQAEAAKAAGWNQSRWSSYEIGDRSPNTDVVKKIIMVLDSHGVSVTFEELFQAAA